jgi:hypothetical protein
MRATHGAQQQQVADQETIGILRRYCDVNILNWRAVGKLFDEILPRHVTIATTSAGIIPYYCDRSCLDLHGLTDPVMHAARPSWCCGGICTPTAM